MKTISQELTPFIHIKSNEEPKGEVMSGDYWIADENYARKIKELGYKY